LPCKIFFHRILVFDFTTGYIQKAMDSVSPEKRSWVMAQVKGRDTRPEKVVRSLLHSMGYRFRLQRKDLPGKPDIVLPKYRTVIFVHGCFWHRHDCPNGIRLPKSKLDFWLPKLEGNKERDLREQAALAALGWRVLIVWECMLYDKEALQEILYHFLENA
jgi:DNA mismatch endonuclease (patch repair protein)